MSLVSVTERDNLVFVGLWKVYFSCYILGRYDMFIDSCKPFFLVQSEFAL